MVPSVLRNGNGGRLKRRAKKRSSGQPVAADPVHGGPFDCNQTATNAYGGGQPGVSGMQKFRLWLGRQTVVLAEFPDNVLKSLRLACRYRQIRGVLRLITVPGAAWRGLVFAGGLHNGTSNALLTFSRHSGDSERYLKEQAIHISLNVRYGVLRMR